MKSVRSAVFATGLVVAGLLAVPVTSASASRPHSSALTNLAHLDFLTASVSPPSQADHTTYRLDTQPAIGVLWVYANHLADGQFQRTGGGDYDATANTYGQGAYDADDLSRAAVVYLRHWRQWHDGHSRDEAYQLLRGLTYLQTASGPNAGNVVLWMQPDGTLHPSAIPVETPNPSDSDASYWLARTLWALGEGYADFRGADPAFAGFLQQRMDLAVAALQREVLSRYAQFQLSNGLRMPAWLIVGGADASSEAVLGLAAYVAAGGSPAARGALSQLADGIAAMSGGDTATWPYGAILPSATSRSMWHAWGSQMASALAAAATALSRPGLLAPAVADTAGFTAHLITATGPDNGWLPAPVDGSQIAYGADGRVQALLAVGQAAHSQGLRQLAGVAAGWYFGQNSAGVPTYDPRTGVTDDGVSADGSLNLNSGAESTIHGLLSMEALDANPDVAAIAQASAHIVSRDGQVTVEAESAALSGAATTVQADPAYTGEAQWSGGAYVQLPPGGALSWTVASADQPRLVQAIVNRVPGAGGVSTFAYASTSLGSVQYGNGGAQGNSATPGALLPVTLSTNLPSGATQVNATTAGGSGQLDAIQLTPLVSTLVVDGGGHSVAVLTSVSGASRSRSVSLPGTGWVTVDSYDRQGRLVRASHTRGGVTVDVPAGGFAVARR